jgi:UDP-glucose 4-epimerase
MTRRILITGGFGYVGGRVAQALAALPDTQVVLGTRHTQQPPIWLPEASVAPISWRSIDSLRRACAGADAVVHLAAMNENDAVRDPVGALEVNGVGTLRMLEAAKMERVARFVYLSTAHVYGAPLSGRIDETRCPRPVHPYATSHRAAEDVVIAAHDIGALIGVVLRLSNGFGAPAHAAVDRWTLLVNDLCRQAVTTGRLVLRSSGLSRRDFITLDDVGSAVAHMLTLKRMATADGIFNLGGAWAPTVSEMTALIARRCKGMLGIDPEIITASPAVGEVSPELEFRIDKLLSTGFGLRQRIEDEIDGTLKVCLAFKADVSSG